jgi:hypothetical protein
MSVERLPQLGVWTQAVAVAADRDEVAVVDEAIDQLAHTSSPKISPQSLKSCSRAFTRVLDRLQAMRGLPHVIVV